MTDPVDEAEVEAVARAMKHTPLPWKTDKYGSYIWCDAAKGGDRPVLDTRGWGYLTGKGSGAIELPPAEAAVEQRAVADFVVAACNSYSDLAGLVRAAFNRSALPPDLRARAAVLLKQIDAHRSKAGGGNG